jgi:hypothetical protein
MADTKISALTAASVAAGANEIPINEAGTSKKLTVTQIEEYIMPTLATVVSATPTLDTSAYASGDCLHTTVISFASAVGAKLTGFIEKMVIVDNEVQSQPCELWLFSATVTPAAANAAHSISDAHAALCIGVIASGTYYASALNSVSVAKGVNLAIKCAATTLYGILVTRGTPTYAVGSLTVSLLISQN